MESPEYEALSRCSATLLDCIQLSPSDIVDELKPSGLLPPVVLSFLGNQKHDDNEKARKIVDVMTKQVKFDSQVFHTFVKAMKAAGPWTMGAVNILENKYKTLQTSTSHSEQPNDPGEVEQLPLGGSDSTTQAQVAPISGIPLPQSGIMEEVMRRNGVTPKQLSRKFDSVDFDRLSMKTVNYQQYGSLLYLSNEDIKEIAQNPHFYNSLKVITAAVFKKWYTKNPSNATYYALLEVAIDLEDGKVADEICRLCVTSEKKCKMEEAMGRNGVIAEQLGRKFKTMDFDRLSEKTVEYEKYGLRLHLSEQNIKEIARNPHFSNNLKVITAEVFKKWYTKNPSKATYHALLEVALDLEDEVVADEICQLCAASENKGTPADTRTRHSGATNTSVQSQLAVDAQSEGLKRSLRPIKLTSRNLYQALHKLTTKLYLFGVYLEIPAEFLEAIKKDHLHDPRKKIFLFIANHHKSLNISWKTIARALKCISYHKLALRVQRQYCCWKPSHLHCNPQRDYSTSDQEQPFPRYFNFPNLGSSTTLRGLKRSLRPIKLTSRNLYQALYQLTTKLYLFGVYLGIPAEFLEAIKKDHLHDPRKKIFLFIANHHKSLNISWKTIARALKCISYHKLALRVQRQYCYWKPSHLQCNPQRDYSTSDQEQPFPRYFNFPNLGSSTTLREQTEPEKLHVQERERSVPVYDLYLSEPHQYMHFFFSVLIEDTAHRMSESKVDIKRVKDILQLTLLGYSKIRAQGAQACDSLKEVSTFHELSIYLCSNYCSWFDYKLIVNMRKEFLFKDATDILAAEYQEKFDACSTPPHQLRHKAVPCSQGDIKAICKVDIDYEKLCIVFVKHVQRGFAETIGFSEHCVRFQEAKDGCTELVFRAPSSIEQVTELSPDQQSKLRDLKIIKIIIGNRCLYRDESYYEDNSESDSVSSLHDDNGVSISSDSGAQCITETDSSSTSSVHVGDLENEPSFSETNIQVLSKEILSAVCKKKLKITEQINLKVFPCSFFTALHDEQPYMALKYNKKIENERQFIEYIKCLLTENKNTMKVNCVHLDNNLSGNPILVFEPKQTLTDFCTSLRPISELEQLSVVHDVAVGILSFPATMQLKVTKEAIFVHKNENGETRGLFSPLYQYSYFPEALQSQELLVDLKWVKDSLLLMHYRNQYHEKSELPKSHILHDIMLYKWFSEVERLHLKDIAKDIKYIRDLENTRLEMIKTLSTSDFLELSHLHMILIGHTGVGKTSIRKHLQNIPLDDQEESTIIMEQELLHQSTLAESGSVIFEKCSTEYIGKPNQLFLTLWDTGGQPMFQDLLPCFAKYRSVYGIVFRICDLLKDSKAVVRPISHWECEWTSSYTYTDYINRCYSFLESLSSNMQLGIGSLPPDVKSVFLKSSKLHDFPKVALIGTFKESDDVVTVTDCELRQQYKKLTDSFNGSHFIFQERALLPENTHSVVFETDNKNSGLKKDQGIIELRKQILSCAHSARTMIPTKWIHFKLKLERNSQLQQPRTGIVSLESAEQAAKELGIDPKAALCYFHEQGIFLWYYESKSLEDQIIIEPNNLISVLGTVLNPKVFNNFEEQWRQLQNIGMLDTLRAIDMLDNSGTGLPSRWIFSYFEKHHLAVLLNETRRYFIPSMLQVLVKICPNFIHTCNVDDKLCSSIVHDSDRGAAPLFLVPKSKCIPPGFFPRLMTILAGIQFGDIVWELLPINGRLFRNLVSFRVNDQVVILFTEFSNCVRIQLASVSDKEISREICRSILSQLKVQVKRVFQKASGPPVYINFTCFCSSEPHFLPHLPSTTEDEVLCNGNPFNFTEAHKKWIKEPAPKTAEDAKKLLDEALLNGSVALKLLNILLIGSTKKVIFDKNDIRDSSIYYIVNNEEVREVQSDYLKTFFANSAAFPVKRNADPQSAKISVHPSEQPVPTTIESENRDLTHKSNVTASEVSDAPKASVVSIEQSDTVEAIVEQSETVEVKSTSLVRENSQSFVQPEKVSEVSTKVDHTEIINLMSSATEEQGHLDLLQTIECNDFVILKLLPLFTQQLSVGVLGSDQISNFKEIHHVSNKWMIVEVEKKLCIADIDVSVRHKLLKENTDRETDIIFAPHTALKRIISVSNKTERKAVPYAWYYFCHCIQMRYRETNRKIVTYDEASALCHNCRILPDDLKKVLNFLNESGLLVYYEDILPAQIFEDISVLVTILKSVLTNKNVHDTVVKEDHFQQVEDVYVNAIFTHVDAIELFKGLCLLLQIEGRSFLIPYLKEYSLNRKDFNQYCEQTSNNSFLCIQYSMTTSVFGFLVCFIASNHNSILWPWKLHVNKDTGDPTCLFKNCAQYTLPGYDCKITLFNSDSFVEVHVEYSDGPPPLDGIRRAVITGLERAHNIFHLAETFRYETGFKCSCGFLDREHVAIFSENKQLLVCSEDPQVTFKLSSLQNIWINNSISLEDDSLSVIDVFKAFLPQYNEWFKVGAGLGLDTQTLSHILVKYKDTADIALMEVVRQWFLNNPNPSWTNISNLLGEESMEPFKKLMKSPTTLISTPLGTGRAIPLCLPNDVEWDRKQNKCKRLESKIRTALVLNPTAVEILNSISGPVCVVSIVGPCRSGKSYVLSRLISEGVECHFDLGHEKDPKTMGIWMWDRPFKIKLKDYSEEVTLILLDTEGIDAANASDRGDSQIFTLSVLLSSLLIYNSMTVPRREDLNQMHFVANLTRSIQVQTGEFADGQGGMKLTQSNPRFMWLLRDVDLTPTDRNNKPCHIKDYLLQKVLGEDATDDQTLNDIRHSLLGFFSSFDAETLPPPSTDRHVMQNIDNPLYQKDISPLFLQQLAYVKKRILDNCSPKKGYTGGTIISGFQLSHMVELYVEALNSPGGIPVVGSTWLRVLEATYTEGVKQAVKYYKKIMEEVTSKLPLKSEQLFDHHREGVKKSLQVFREATELDSESESNLYQTYLDKLMSQLAAYDAKGDCVGGELALYLKRNNTVSKLLCQSQINKLKGQHLDPLISNLTPATDFKTIEAVVARIISEYDSMSVGPASAEVLSNFIEQWKTSLIVLTKAKIESVSVATISSKRKDMWSREETVMALLGAFNLFPKETIEAELVNLLESNPWYTVCKVKDTGKGSIFEISNWLLRSGVYQLHVRVGGEEVRGSPFPVTVKTPVSELGAIIKTINGVNNPWGVGVKKSGEVIVAEESSDCISVFSCIGEKTHPTDAQDQDIHLKHICSPRGLAVDSEDNILVVQGGRSQLLKISPEGECRIAPVGNKFIDPVGVCVSSITGQIYVVDETSHCVHILNSDLTYSSKFGTYGSGNGELLSPTGIAHSKGYLYVADTNNNRVQVFTSDGEYVLHFGMKGVDSELFRPISICVDDDDLVYVGERVSIVSVFTTKGDYCTSFNSLQPYGIAVAPCGVIYVCDHYSGKIYMY